MRIERVLGTVTSGTFLAATLLVASPTVAQDSVDLWVSWASQATAVSPGQRVPFTLYAGSRGPAPASGARLRVRAPAGLTDFSWTCTVQQGTTACPSANGSGEIDDALSFDSPGSVRYAITATVEPGAVGRLIVPATIILPAGLTDPRPGNNSRSAFFMAPTEAPTQMQVFREGDAGISGLSGARGVAVSPDGQNVYVTGSGPAGTALATFSRDPGTGALTFLEGRTSSAGPGTGQAVTVSPDGRHVYLVSGAIGVYERTAAAGRLTLVQQVPPTVYGVSGAVAVTLSADGRSLYVASDGDNALVAFARDTATGILTHLETFVDGSNGVEGLKRASGVAVSPDGASVYATSYDYGDNGVAFFSRNGSTGRLAFVEAFRAVPSLTGLQSPVVSHDGRRVYVIGWGQSNIGVLSRDVATGRLTLQELLQDLGREGLNQLALGPDGTRLHATGVFGGSVSWLSVSTADGSLGTLGSARQGTGGVTGLSAAYGVAVSPDGAQVYVTGSADSALVVFALPRARLIAPAPNSFLSSTSATFAWTAAAGAAAYSLSVGSVPGGTDLYQGDQGLALSRTVVGLPDDGRPLYVRLGCKRGVDWTSTDYAYTAYSPSPPFIDLSLLKYADQRAVRAGDPVTFTIVVGNRGPASLTGQRVIDDLPPGLTDAAWTCLASSGSSCGNGTGSIDQPIVLPPNEKLTYRLTATVSPPPTGSSVWNEVAVTVPQDLTLLGAYPLAYASVEVVTTAGALRFLEDQRAGLAGDDGVNHVSGLATSPDGRHLYATGYGTFTRGLASYGRSRSSGHTELITTQISSTSGTGFGQGLAFSADGRFLYAVSGELVVHERDAETGTVASIQAFDWWSLAGLGGAFALALSPDGRSVYVASDNGNALLAFSRDGILGRLTHLETFMDGAGGVDGLERARGVAVSPDGAHVYVTGYTDNAIAVFRRAPDGRLTFVEAFRDTDLGAPGSPVVSPDGANVYVAGWSYSNVVTLRRDAATGLLAKTGSVGRNNGIATLNGLENLVIAPDGSRVFATCMFANAVAVFERDPGTGTLTYAGVQKQGIGGVDGLATPRSIALSPDGSFLYLGSDAAALAVFAVSNTMAGTNVTVRPLEATGTSAPVTLTFATITEGGTTTVEVATGEPPVLPAGFALGDPPTYFDISTTASYAGAVQVCLDYSGTSYTNEAELRLFHFEGGSWVEVPAILDTQQNTICGPVTSLSPFAVMQPSNRPPEARAQAEAVVECGGPSGTLVTLDGSSSSDPDADPLTYRWESGNAVVGSTAVVTLSLPVGLHRFTLRVSDGRGGEATDEVVVTVRDTKSPALSVSLSPAVLWPPDGRLVRIKATLKATDVCDAAPKITLHSIVSNEPAAGDIRNASIGTDDRVFALRATRSGRGSGRLYRVSYRAVDASGNAVTVTGTVSVPHDRARADCRPDEPRGTPLTR